MDNLLPDSNQVKPTIVEIAATRPNFMKVAPIHRIASESKVIQPILIHTEQHYDPVMSEVFFSDLSLAEPLIRLDVGSGTHAEQTARVMTRLEPHLMELQPAAVVVVGDVNSTLAAALCAAKLNIPVVHVEAGLRSFNREMPEEINRVATDAISSLLLAPSEDAVDNLLREGHPPKSIELVGNVMIDSLEAMLPRAHSSSVLSTLGLRPREYFLVTLHRPSNVDAEDRLAGMVEILARVAERGPVVFVVHPRTMNQLEKTGSIARLEASAVTLLAPTGYVDFLALEDSALAVLTDSGGIQEETTILGVPCLTLREETERPITVTLGTNHVVGRDVDRILAVIDKVCSGEQAVGNRPPLWDGKTAERIVRVLEREYGA